MTDKEYTAEELCRQYMGRAKEGIISAGAQLKQAKNVDDMLEKAVINALSGASVDIHFAMFQLGRIFEQNSSKLGDKK